MKKLWRLLIVEDDLTLRKVIAAYLREAGFRILLAEDAKEFYKLFRKVTLTWRYWT